MKYLLVAKFTIPKSYVTGEFEPTGENPQEEVESGHRDLFDEEKIDEAPLPEDPVIVRNMSLRSSKVVIKIREPVWEQYQWT